MTDTIAETPPVEPDEEEDLTPPQVPAEPGGEEGEQPETPETLEAAGAVSEREMERAIAKLEREAERHRNRVAEIMGEDAQTLVACELCEPAIPGFRWPQPLDPDRTQAVLGAIGLGELAERKHDPEAETCDLCDGQGELVTGSKVLNQLTRVCKKCDGNGWTTSDQRRNWDGTQGARDAAAGLAAVPQQQPPASSELPATDAWGRPIGHEFYGRNPVYMTAEQRARDVPGAV